MLIRKYLPTDRSQVEHINFETGYLGSSMSELLTNNDIWKKSIEYYLDNEPESIFVLDDKGKIEGYLFGCLDDRKNNGVFHFITFNIINLARSLFLPQKDKIFFRSQFMSLIYTILGKSDEIKFDTPKKAGHIHINLLPKVRGKNYGTKLLKEFEKYARKKGVKIIHADSFETKVSSNKNFWIKNDFKIYSKVKTSIWKKQLPNEKINLVCYNKKL